MTAACTLGPHPAVDRQPRMRSGPLLTVWGSSESLSLLKTTNSTLFSAMQTSTKIPSLSASKSTTTLWTARLVATLWKLAVKRARMLRKQSQSDTDQSNISPASADLDETSIMHEAALSVVASGVVSLADLESVTGFRLSKVEMPQTKDDDESSEAATDTDSCSIADSDLSEGVGEEPAIVSPERRVAFCEPLAQQPVARRVSTDSRKRAKWVCVGYGRYVKVDGLTMSVGPTTVITKVCSTT